MIYKRIANKIIFRVDRGEEIISSIKQICKENNVSAGVISGIGATDNAEIGVYDVSKKFYKTEKIIRNHEITSLLGNVSVMNGETYLHLHVNLANDEFNVIGGHLNNAIVSGTLEAVIDIIDGEICRERNEDIGLNLLVF